MNNLTPFLVTFAGQQVFQGSLCVFHPTLQCFLPVQPSPEESTSSLCHRWLMLYAVAADLLQSCPVLSNKNTRVFPVWPKTKFSKLKSTPYQSLNSSCLKHLSLKSDLHLIPQYIKLSLKVKSKMKMAITIITDNAQKGFLWKVLQWKFSRKYPPATAIWADSLHEVGIEPECSGAVYIVYNIYLIKNNRLDIVTKKLSKLLDQNTLSAALKVTYCEVITTLMSTVTFLRLMSDYVIQINSSILMLLINSCKHFNSAKRWQQSFCTNWASHSWNWANVQPSDRVNLFSWDAGLILL